MAQIWVSSRCGHRKPRISAQTVSATISASCVVVSAFLSRHIAVANLFAHTVQQSFADSRSILERKGGSAMTIFGKRDDQHIEVPEIEVHGNEATVSNPEDVAEADQPDRTVRLPKTKWF
jgi:hypothetical protein